MPIQFRCPKCQTVDTAEDNQAGARVHCRQCGAVLQLPGQTQQIREPPAGGLPPPVPQSPSSEWAERPERRRREDAYDERRYGRDDYGLPSRELSPSWGTVRTGLGMMYWSLVAIILMSLVVVLLSVFTAAGQARQPGFRQAPGPESVLAGLGGCGMLVASLIYFIGACMCCAAPAESQARGYAIGSVLCGVLILMAYVGMAVWIIAAGGAFAGRPDQMFDLAGRGMAMGVIFFAVSILALYVFGHMLRINFLKAVARFFRNESLARSATSYLILFVIFLVLYVLAVVLQIAVLGVAARPGVRGGQEVAGVIAIVIGCITVVLAIVIFVWFLILLSKTRDTIRQAMAPTTY
jgi:hypothetical protein